MESSQMLVSVATDYVSNKFIIMISLVMIQSLLWKGDI